MPPKRRKITPPTEEEWETMQRHKTVVVGGRTFREKDDVVLHSKEDESNAWVASLRQIRLRRDRELWIRVRWYQSARDIGQIIDSFNPQSFSTLERAISDQSDILGAGCLKEVTRCHRYREEDLNPPDIGPNDYFQRYSVDFENGDISPEPGAFTCLPQCSRPYNPFPGAKKGRLRKVKVDEFNPIWDVMHFCPRPQCNGRWYHRSCLAQAGYRDNESSVYVGDRRVRLLAADPDSEDLHPTFVDFATLRSDLEDSHDVDQVQGPSKPLPSALDFLPTSISRRLCHLPAELVTIAAQPIVRRALAPHSYSDCRSGVFSTVGTMKEVVLARRLVYQALEGEHERLEQLCSRLLQSSADAPYWADSDLRDDVRDTIRVFASPRKKYWQDRASLSEPDFLRDVGQCPSTVCPQCGSAI